MLKDNPVLLQLQKELSNNTATKQDITPSKPKRPASMTAKAKTRGPVQTAAIKRQAPSIRVSDKKESDALAVAKQQILDQASRWGRAGTEEAIQGILIGVMTQHGVDAANKIIMETKLNKFGWSAQL